MVKRPLGLKASKSTKKSKPSTTTSTTDETQTTTTTEAVENKTQFTTIGFKSNQEGNDEDGLTIEDLYELVIQSKQTLIRFYLYENLEFGNESSNLLRGICHECERRMNLGSSTNSTSISEETVSKDLVFSCLAWASFSLGFLIYPIGQEPIKKLIRVDEPNQLEKWIWISLKSLESVTETHEDFKLLKPTVLLIQSLLKPENEIQSESSLETLKNWSQTLQAEISKINLSESETIWLITSSLRIIESISPNWDDSFLTEIGSQTLFNLIQTLLESFIEKLSKLSHFDDLNLIKVLEYSIVFHLAQTSLLHGSSLAESIEDKYFPEEDEEEEHEKEEEGFAIDVNDPIYKDTLHVLHLAEVSFVKAIEILENDTSLKDTKQEIIKDLNVQLSETLLTLGNMLEPGEEQEKVYNRASELSGVTI